MKAPLVGEVLDIWASHVDVQKTIIKRQQPQGECRLAGSTIYITILYPPE